MTYRKLIAMVSDTRLGAARRSIGAAMCMTMAAMFLLAAPMGAWAQNTHTWNSGTVPTGVGNNDVINISGNPEGRLTVPGGATVTIEGTVTNNGARILTLIINEGATVNWLAQITGASGATVASDAVVRIEGSGTFIVGSGGRISSSQNIALTLQETGTVTISGGTVERTGPSSSTGPAIRGAANGRVNVTSGTVSGTGIWGAIRFYGNPQCGEVNVSGGTVSSTHPEGPAIQTQCGSITISEGTVTSRNASNSPGTIRIQSSSPSATLTINGGEITNTGSGGQGTSDILIGVSAGNNVIIAAPTIDAADIATPLTRTYDGTARNITATLNSPIIAPRPTVHLVRNGAEIGPVSLPYALTNVNQSGTYELRVTTRFVGLNRQIHSSTAVTRNLPTVTINPADYTFNVATTQNIIFGSGLPAITVVPANPTGTGVGGANVAGTFGWFSNSGRTTPAADVNLSSVSIGGTVTLYWRFTANDPNYTTTPKTGETVFTIVAGPQQNVTFPAPTVNRTFGDAGFTHAATNNSSGGGAITYASGNTSVATVNATTGAVTIVSAGTAVITATAAVVPGTWAQTSTNYTLTVNQRNMTGAQVGDFGTLIYNGSLQLPSATVTVGGLSATGSWSQVTNVGQTTTFTADGNFTGTITGQDPKMNPLPVTVTPNANQNKVYGQNDPAFTFTPAAPPHGGSFTGALGRASGENVNTYAFTLGNLSAGNNYTLSLGGTNQFAITPLAVTINPDPGQGKVFGEANPSITYTTEPTNPANWNNTNVVLTHDGVNVGDHQIKIGTNNAGDNYNVSLNSATFAITPRIITFAVDPIPAQPYTGSQITPTVVVKDGERNQILALTTDYTVEYGQNINVATGGRVDIAGAGNYAGSSGNATFTITKADPTITTPIPVALTATYNETLGDIVLPIPTGTSGQFSLDQPPAHTASVGTVTNPTSGLTLTFTPADTDNFNVRNNIAATLTVGKATRPGTISTHRDVLYNNTALQTVDLSSYITTYNVSPVEPLTYTPQAATGSHSGIIASSASATNGITFTIASGLTENTNAGNSAIIPVVVSGFANYNNITVNVEVELTAKTVVDESNITVTPPVGITYGGVLGNPSASIISGDIGAHSWTFTYSGVMANNATYGPSTDKPTQPGAYTVTAILNSNTHTGQAVSAELTIARKQLTWDANGTVESRPYYGGTSATVAIAPTFVGVINNDDVSVTLGTVTFNSANAATSIAVTAVGYGKATTGDHWKYYPPTGQPTFANGEITPFPVTIIPTSGLYKVFGGSRPPLTYTTDPASPPNWDLANVTLSHAGVNAGTHAIIMGTDNSGGNYDVTLSTATTVYFTINRATISALSRNHESVFNVPEQTVNLSSLLASYNTTNATLNFAPGAVIGTDPTVINAATISGTANGITFNLAADLTSADVGKTATIPVVVSGFDNYYDITVNVEVAIADVMHTPATGLPNMTSAAALMWTLIFASLALVGYIGYTYIPRRKNKRK